MDMNMYMTYVYSFLGMLGLLAVLGFMYMTSLVKRSVGMEFMKAMSKAKKLNMKNKSVVLLRIRDLSGNEQYDVRQVSKIIIYTYEENGNKIEKPVIYDDMATTTFNGVKVLNVTPASIIPIDKHTGSYVDINPELTNKIITDAGKTAEGEKDRKAILKQMGYIVGIVIVGVILLASFFWNNQVELMDKLQACYATGKAGATIIAK